MRIHPRHLRHQSASARARTRDKHFRGLKIGTVASSARLSVMSHRRFGGQGEGKEIRLPNTCFISHRGQGQPSGQGRNQHGGDGGRRTVRWRDEGEGGDRNERRGRNLNDVNDAASGHVDL